MMVGGLGWRRRVKLTRVGAGCHMCLGSLKRCWGEAHAHSDEEAKWHMTKTVWFCVARGLRVPSILCRGDTTPWDSVSPAR